MHIPASRKELQMPNPTPTATLGERTTTITLNNHPPVPGGSAERGESPAFAPDFLVITTTYTDRPAVLLHVVVTARDRSGREGRWSSSTRDSTFRLAAIPESLRTLVLAFEPSLAAYVEWTPEVSS